MCVRGRARLGRAFFRIKEEAVMLDAKTIRNNPELVRESLVKRNGNPGLVDKFLAVDEKRRKNLAVAEELKSRRNKESETVARMKKLCAQGDVVLPNLTEATFLADCYRGRPEVEAYQLREIAKRICDLGAKAVVITSAVVGGKSQVYGYEADGKNSFSVPYERIPLRLPGTGDLFAAFLAGHYLKGMSLEGSTRKTVDILERLILADQEKGTGYKGIPVEQYWEKLGV